MFYLTLILAIPMYVILILAVFTFMYINNKLGGK